MRKKMTDADKAKIKASKEAAKAKRKAQTIVIDEHWKLVRLDEMNWVLEHDGEFNGYFGTLHGAFRALPAKMLSAEARGSIHEVQRCHAAIVEKVEQALGKLSI